ncbi:PucR family transcriptional regulator [Actinomycetospora lemnae]|uniref:Helix-turn-helix domain-containing protein n=1 Tax=Actinomycetospora lemnae TaxID=3019891 RepID=A0ABT5T2F3_9PSEU|nr:helix-turn-helix domain-containing protein [Actinomycetospora sp. DW7H6]MDD7968118.1 helix-turn-helix domain-containing protein [Actinomycetospora sp. DW7H6]
MDSRSAEGSSSGGQALSDGQARAEVETALAREYRFQHQLSEALVADVPEQGIAEVLQEHLGLGVAVEDPFGHVLARGRADGQAPCSRLTRAQRDRLVDAARRMTGPVRVRDQLASLAVSRGTVLGVVVVLDPQGTLEPPDKTPELDARPGSPRAGALHAIGLATGALTLHLLHRRHLARTELRLRHDLVETVLLECDQDGLEAEVDRRVGQASALGHDLTGPHRVLAVRPRHGHWPDGQAVGDLVEQAARSLDMPYLGTLRGQTAILVCGTPGAWLGDGSPTAPWSGRPATGSGVGATGSHEPRSGSAWQAVHDAFTHVLQDAPAVGVGSYVDRPEHLPRSYREAMQALTVRTRQADPRGLLTFEDLGLYRLLATPEGRREAGAFVEDWIGSLLAYDAERQADLVHTLGVYLDHGGNYDATAAALHIHRSTLRYRLQRIRELSGHDLTHTDTRLNLHVAVRAAVVADPAVLPGSE